MEKDVREMDKKQRRQIPLQDMPELEPDVRNKCFDEVTLGLSLEQARLEAARCIQCKDPQCIVGCPVSINIPGFLEQIVNEDLDGAINTVWDKTALPAVCGRVCPQEIQCEVVCIVGKKKGRSPVGIGNLEMFIADWAREAGVKNKVKIPPSTGKKVAVVGSGPAGITVAGDLAVKGHDVTVFEAFHKAGGVLLYGIPEFRLAKDIVDYELEGLKDLGVKIECNNVIGRTIGIDELIEERKFDCVFIGVGAGLPSFLGIPGEDLNGVFSANEYLTRANLMKGFDFPNSDTPLKSGKNVVVLGAGNVAMDSARTAVRMGAQNVTIVYRRTREEAPSRHIEIHHADEEGVQFNFLTSPLEFIGDANGKLVGLNCQKMELGGADEDGRRRPIAIDGEQEYIKCDMAIISIGTNANPLLTNTTDGLELNKWGNIKADRKTGKTTKDKVWAGGDITLGQATVILAMGTGRDAAEDMHRAMMAE